MSQAAAIGARIAKVGTAIEKGDKQTVTSGINRAKLVIEDHRNKATGGDGKLSNFRGSFGLSVTIGDREAKVVAKGPWGLLEEGADAHVITSQHGGRSRKRRAAAAVAALLGQEGGTIGGGRKAVLKIPDIGYRRYAFHPGTDDFGKPFETGAKASHPKVAEAMRKRSVNIVRSAFK